MSKHSLKKSSLTTGNCKIKYQVWKNMQKTFFVEITLVLCLTFFKIKEIELRKTILSWHNLSFIHQLAKLSLKDWMINSNTVKESIFPNKWRLIYQTMKMKFSLPDFFLLLLLPKSFQNCFLFYAISKITLRQWLQDSVPKEANNFHCSCVATKEH